MTRRNINNCYDSDLVYPNTNEEGIMERHQVHEANSLIKETKWLKKGKK